MAENEQLVLGTGDEQVQDTPPATPAEPRPATETPAPEPEPQPHPLEPGGPRFEEVYRRMKQSEQDAGTLRERLAKVEGELQGIRQPSAPSPQAQVYSHEQLQQMVDAGRITTGQMSQQLAWQAKEQAKQEFRQELQQETRRTTATGEVNDYLSRVPELNDPTSPKFRKVAAVAWEIADEMGVGVNDARVQRRALREVVGPISTLAQADRAREFDRRAIAPTEAGPGGGRDDQRADPLKDVPKAQMDHWKKLNYTREEMIDEAKYLRPRAAR